MVRLAGLILLVIGLHFAPNGALAMAEDVPSLAVGDTSCIQASTRCDLRFAGNDNLYPGGPPALAAVEVAYRSHSQRAAVQLYVAEFEGRSVLSSPLCTATSPATLFNVAINAERHALYAGSLDALARLASTPGGGLFVPAPGGHPRWMPGDGQQVTISIGLDRSADNAYMGCSVQVAFGWFLTT
jgi:hypothetical protein